MNVDKKIEELGFKVVEYDKTCNILLYENKAAEHTIEINWTDEEINQTDEEVYLYSYHDDLDDFGHKVTYSMGMTSEECRAFLAKMDEIKSGLK